MAKESGFLQDFLTTPDSKQSDEKKRERHHGLR
jgi:hypothetical protein